MEEIQKKSNQAAESEKAELEKVKQELKELKQQQEQDKKEKKAKTKKFIFDTILIIIILLLLGHLFWVKNTFCEPCPDITNVKLSEILDGEVKDTDKDAIKEDLQKKQDETMFSLKFDSAGYLAPNSNQLKFNIANAAKNSLSCSIELFYEGESIYLSDIMKPGQRLETITLSRTLPEGTYTMEGCYHIYYGDVEIGLCAFDFTLYCE